MPIEGPSLAIVRPILLPEMKGDEWSEECRATNMAKWTLNYGAKTHLPTAGTRLHSVSGAGNASLQHPYPWWNNFELEQVWRQVTGSEIALRFRYLDSSNYQRLHINTSGTLALTKIVAGAFTTIGSTTGHTGWRRLRMRVTGALTTVWMDGVQVMSVTDAANQGNTRLYLYVNDGTVQPQGEWEYFAGRRLG